MLHNREQADGQQKAIKERKCNRKLECRDCERDEAVGIPKREVRTVETNSRDSTNKEGSRDAQKTERTGKGRADDQKLKASWRYSGYR